MQKWVIYLTTSLWEGGLNQRKWVRHPHKSNWRWHKAKKLSYTSPQIWLKVAEIKDSELHVTTSLCEGGLNHAWTKESELYVTISLYEGDTNKQSDLYLTTSLCEGDSNKRNWVIETTAIVPPAVSQNMQLEELLGV